MRPLGLVQAEYCQQGNTPQPFSSGLGGRRRAASACVYLMQSREPRQSSPLSLRKWRGTTSCLTFILCGVGMVMVGKGVLGGAGLHHLRYLPGLGLLRVKNVPTCSHPLGLWLGKSCFLFCFLVCTWEWFQVLGCSRSQDIWQDIKQISKKLLRKLTAGWSLKS